VKIDVFNHLYPPGFVEEFERAAPLLKDMGKRVRNISTLANLDNRFRMMDEFGNYRQIISLASPPIESYAAPDLAVHLARVANDGMAELVRRYPDRFIAFAASLPMNHPDAALKELERAAGLGALGAQIFSNAAGKPLDAPEFLPLFDEVARRDLAVWLHPARGANFPDYRGEEKSKYEIWWTFG